MEKQYEGLISQWRDVRAQAKEDFQPEIVDAINTAIEQTRRGCETCVVTMPDKDAEEWLVEIIEQEGLRSIVEKE